jgi:hypothetical protein
MKEDKLKIDELNEKLRRINSMTEKIPNFEYCEEKTVNVSCDSHDSDYNSCYEQDWCTDYKVTFGWDKDGKLINIFVNKSGNHCLTETRTTTIEYDIYGNVFKISYFRKGSFEVKTELVIENNVLFCNGESDYYNDKWNKIYGYDSCFCVPRLENILEKYGYN